jgi:hypothetical protein
MRPTAKILFLITRRRSTKSLSTGDMLATAPVVPSLSSSCVHILSTADNMSVTAMHDQSITTEASRPRGLTLLADERQTPTESVHKVGKPVGVWHVVELPDAEHVRLVFDHRCLVVIDVQIIRRREKSHHAREPGLAALAIHAIAIDNFHHSTQPRGPERARRLAYPESWASCARMIESN